MPYNVVVFFDDTQKPGSKHNTYEYYTQHTHTHYYNLSGSFNLRRVAYCTELASPIFFVADVAGKFELAAMALRSSARWKF